MTKHVRIENADGSDHKLRVYVEDRLADGTWIRSTEPVKLDYPTMMASEYVHSTRRIVIEELVLTP
jgi:hypothetical protein